MASTTIPTKQPNGWCFHLSNAKWFKARERFRLVYGLVLHSMFHPAVILWIMKRCMILTDIPAKLHVKYHSPNPANIHLPCSEVCSVKQTSLSMASPSSSTTWINSSGLSSEPCLWSK